MPLSSSLFFYKKIASLYQNCHKKITPDESPKIYADTGLIQAKDDEKGCPRY